jgi:taurine dioxygenase
MDIAPRPEVRRVTSAIGAVIDGVDLGRPLDGETLRLVRQALLDHGVLFFRNQDASVEQLWDFLRNFGTPQKEDSLGITLLRMVRGPAFGGDTCWASTVAAYEALSRPLREMLDGLTAVHSVAKAVSPLGDYGDAFVAQFGKLHAAQQIHPVVQAHPETGRKALFVTESCTTRIVELEPAESRCLLDLLVEHVKSPDFCLRWRWSPNDLALWDNRSVQHYAVPDYTAERVVHRIVVAGDRPRGPAQAA